MAKFEKSKGRTPIAEGRPQLGYSGLGRNKSHEYAISIYNEKECKYYYLRMSSEEMEHVVKNWKEYKERVDTI